MTNIKINSIKLNYEVEGEGFPIVLIHGLSDNHTFWKPLKDELKKEYKVISYDLRGHGKSDKGDGKVTMDLYQDDLFKLLENLKIKKVALIGLSLGGNIALDFTIKHSEMVSSLVLMSTYSEINHKLKGIFKNLKESLEINYEIFYDNILKYCLPEDFIEEHKDQLEAKKKENADNSNIQGIINGINAGNTFFITNDLRKIDQKTLVIAGENDELTPLHNQKKMQKQIKNSELLVLENTKHNVLISKNQKEILEKIKEIINE